MGLARPARARASGRINASCACLPGKTRGCFAAAFFFMTPLALRSLALCSLPVFVHGLFSPARFFRARFSETQPSAGTRGISAGNYRLAADSPLSLCDRCVAGGPYSLPACVGARFSSSRADWMNRLARLLSRLAFFCRRAGGRKALKIRSEFKGSEMSLPQSSLGHNAMERGADQVLPAPCPAHFHKWSAGQLRGASGRFIWE